MAKDTKGHEYADVDNIRLTFIPAADRAAAKNWANQDVIRIQSYRNAARGKAVHRGAELPVEGPDAALRFVAAFARLCLRRGPGD